MFGTSLLFRRDCRVRIAAWFSIVLAVGCENGDSPTEPPDPGSSDTLRVAELMIDAGVTRRFDAGTVIMSDGDVTLRGEIVVDAATAGDFTINSASGTVTIDGTIRVDDAGRLRGGGGSLPRGTSIVIESRDRARAHVVFGPGTRLRSGNGRDAPAEVITSSGLTIEGGAGSDAGDIIVTAFGGTITLPESLDDTSAPLFMLGTGGRGADLTISRGAFTTERNSLHAIAGRGGESGRLVLEATQVLNRPAIVDRVPIIDGGRGGDGGFAVWDNSADGMLNASEGAVDRTFPLAQIALEGGSGGAGTMRGGDGGTAAYFGARVINERSAAIATAAAYGGNGGSVFPSPVPVPLVIGGSGGSYIAVGNDGWDASAASEDGPRNGANGGDSFGRGGDGGSVQEGVTAFDARGGAAGHTTENEQRLPERLPVLSATYSDGFYGVIGGAGGEGRIDCTGCPGGGGGDHGLASAIGGTGGTVMNAPITGVGGRGGNVWNATAQKAGDGGNGYPPGQGGTGSDVVTLPGAGGNGPTGGAAGTVRIAGVPPIDGVAGTECGADEDGCTGGAECGADGAGFDVTFEKTWGDIEGPDYARTDASLSGMKTEFGIKFFGGSTTHTIVSNYKVTYEETNTLNQAAMNSLLQRAANPVCIDGMDVQWADEGEVRIVQDPIDPIIVSFQLTGCNPFHYDQADRDRYYCCDAPGEPEAWVVCY